MTTSGRVSEALGGSGSSGGIERTASEIVPTVESWTGLGLGWLIAGIVVLALFLVFFGGSGKGRGRRFRRGFRVGYMEELGKQRARERVKDHPEGEHTRGHMVKVLCALLAVVGLLAFGAVAAHARVHVRRCHGIPVGGCWIRNPHCVNRCAP